MDVKEASSSLIMEIPNDPLTELEYAQSIIEFVIEENIAWYEDQRNIDSDLERLSSTSQVTNEVLDKTGTDLHCLCDLFDTFTF